MECLAAMRYARSLACATGNCTCVYFDAPSNSFSVYYQSDGADWDPAPVAQPMGQGGSYTISLSTTRELQNTTFSFSPATANQFTYSPLGSCDTAATITFTFGSSSRQVIVPLVGDPTLN